MRWIYAWIEWIWAKWRPKVRMIGYEETYKLDTEASETDENYKKEQVEEMTPAGKVRMKYDEEDKCFLYWSDATIPTKYLDTVARKYVMVFNKREWYEKTEVEYTRRKQEELKGPFIRAPMVPKVEIKKKMNRFKKKGGWVQVELPKLNGKNISFKEYKDEYARMDSYESREIQRGSPAV